MDIFNDKLYKSYEDCYFIYEISRDSHSESIYMIFFHSGDSVKTDKEKRYILVENAPLLSNWFKLLGYDKNEDQIIGMLKEVGSILDVIPIRGCDTEDKVLGFLKSVTVESYSDQMKRTYSILKPIMSEVPLLGCVYSELYSIFYGVWSALNNPEAIKNICRWMLPDIKHCAEHLEKLEEVYNIARKYCKAIFQIDNAPGATASPKTISYIYRDYCRDAATDYYPNKPVLNSSPKPISYEEMYDKPMSMPWEIYYQARKDGTIYGEASSEAEPIYTIEDIAFAGIDYLMESESVIRNCKLCGKGFRVRYTSSQEYCTRLYADTKAACNEYASRKSYKDRLFQHPIHQEFTKAYNRLYGRIRRGKLPADTPLMDQLKRLHEDYYERYESTHFKNREEVWKEYIERNKELLAQKDGE